VACFYRVRLLKRLKASGWGSVYPESFSMRAGTGCDIYRGAKSYFLMMGQCMLFCESTCSTGLRLLA